ncbi:hypothetical protein DM01DRAFT_1293138 [Hesseltinella vesiculosa]|uniref:Integrator complex subunit 7 N-terminal domain-containing protein n=1 Tax=Hesseltinella vesiculosa TaxID=101127 RepID=A0A1X2G7Q4_9FUNG|nr:hypothetical protein DM01DRAFT_1293138 [Hesseltinella vesiculosa]
MAPSDDDARLLEEGHKALLMLEAEFSKKATFPTDNYTIKVKALARFPNFLTAYPFAVIINATLLKLADWFCTSNNVVRMHIYKVLHALSPEQLKKAMSHDQVAKRLLPVCASNDPIARGLTLRTLGTLASIVSNDLDVQYAIISILRKTTDRFELEAVVWAADEVCGQAPDFLAPILDEISTKLRNTMETTNQENIDNLTLQQRSRLINILRHMHANPATAQKAKMVCIELLEYQHTSETITIAVLQILSIYASTAVLDHDEFVGFFKRWKNSSNDWTLTLLKTL